MITKREKLELDDLCGCLPVRKLTVEEKILEELEEQSKILKAIWAEYSGANRY